MMDLLYIEGCNQYRVSVLLPAPRQCPLCGSQAQIYCGILGEWYCSQCVPVEVRTKN